MGAPTTGTMTYSDIYGLKTPGVTGNSSNGPSDEQVASGNLGKTGGQDVTISWLGMVAALVLLRFLIAEE
jgi:hypothetical protein